MWYVLKFLRTDFHNYYLAKSSLYLFLFIDQNDTQEHYFLRISPAVIIYYPFQYVGKVNSLQLYLEFSQTSHYLELSHNYHFWNIRFSFFLLHLFIVCAPPMVSVWRSEGNYGSSIFLPRGFWGLNLGPSQILIQTFESFINKSDVSCCQDTLVCTEVF